MDYQTAAAPQPTGSQNKIEQLLVNRPVILQLLRFVAIGVLNTALDFIIFNMLSKWFGIAEGVSLGYINVIGFACATIQSYIWNRYWAFSGNSGGIYKNFIRLMLVGGLGAAAFIGIIIGSSMSALPPYYFLLLFAFVVFEVAFWINFKLKSEGGELGSGASGTQQFVVFVIVSVVGLLINSGLVIVLSNALPDTLPFNADLAKNLAKALATGVSLIWNFLGYKLIVFKK